MRTASCLIVMVLLGLSTAARAQSLTPEADFSSNPSMKGWSFEQQWMKSKFAKQSEGEATFVRVNSPPVVAKLEFEIPADAKSLTVVLDGRVSGLEKGKQPWDIPMVQVQLMKEGEEKPVNKPWATAIKFNEDTSGWTQKRTTIPVPEGVTKAVVNISYKAKKGNLDLKQIAIYDTAKAPEGGQATGETPAE